MNLSEFNVDLDKATLSYQDYLSYMESFTTEHPQHRQIILTDEQVAFAKLNYQRSARIKKSHKTSPALLEEINAIKSPQTWLALTEGWCGDSAQSLSIVAKAAEANPHITLGILLRDEHPEIMERFLTNGTKSIPIIAVFDEKGNQLFKWGPRPKAGQTLFSSLKAEGLEKEEINQKLHLWYGRNRGEEVEKEFAELLRLSQGIMIDNT